MHSPTLTVLLLSAATLAVACGDKISSPASNPLSANQRHLLAQAPSCSLQPNVDFAGNDIANAPATAAADCCAKCQGQSGCNAFTWTNFNGGTCWLKSTKGTNVVAVAGAQSAEMNTAPTPPSSASCPSIDIGVDYVANDIANVAAAKATDCCAKCSAQSGCGAFTWTNWNGGTCWLKSGKGATKANPDAYSSTMTYRNGSDTATTMAPRPAEPPIAGSPTCPTVEQNTDYTGADIANVPGSGATDCCAKCRQQAGCGAFTWTNFNGGTCWLKRERGTAKALPGGVSAVMAASTGSGPSPTVAPTPPASANVGAGSCAVVEENTDYTGTDVANVLGSGPSDCCAKCKTQSGCNAFTWTNWNGGTCWLKSGKGSGKFVAGAVSAVVIAPSATTPSPTTVPQVPTPGAHIQPRLRSGEVPLRSVNLGGWLVGENWMSLNSTAWADAGDAAGQGEYVTMQRLGQEKGTRQFEQHRATWITEADIKEIASAGMNAVRVPVGFWIVNDDPTTTATAITRVYAAGALKYLDTLINDWAVKYNLAVMLSLHAHQGSQNGYDHSAPQAFGAITWSNSQANVDNSLQFATVLAARYQNSVAFLGMNLMNEPMYPTNADVVESYYKDAYARIRATGNNCILVTSPPLWNQSPPTMMTFMLAPMYTNVWHEFHVYFRWTLEGKDEAEIMEISKHYRRMNLDPWTGNPLLLGEWSLAGPDSAPFQDKEILKQYAAIQLTNYEAARSGWAFWSWRHDEETTKISGWSLRQLLREGIFSIPRAN